jgi:APA family basic amino acid/polyamine antiporter
MNASAEAGERALGFWMCLALVVGNIIGTGIFLLPAALAPYGANALVGWVVTIGGGLCLAYVFAALARAMPDAGGPYAFIKTAFGAPAAFFVLWSYWISLWVTNAAVAIGGVSYLTALAPPLAATPAAGPIVASVFVILFTANAARGARAAGRVQVVTTLLKIMPLVAVIVLAALVLGRGGDVPGGFAPMPISGDSIASAAALALWAMLGFESATVPSGKVRDPARTVPTATLLGTLIVGFIYLFTSTAVTLLMPAEAVARSSAPLADLVAGFWGAGAAAAVAAFAAVSALGALNGWVLLQAEVPLALARSGVFPQAFARVNRAGMPIFGQWLGCGLTCLLIATNLSRGLAGIFQFMILLATAATLVLYFAAAMAALLLVVRRRLPSLRLGIVAAAGALYSLGAFWGAGAEAMGWGLFLVASGIPVYLLMRRAGRSNRVEEAHRGELQG